MKNHQIETIQEYVNRVASENDWNHEDIAKRAQEAGFKLSAGYVNNIMNGYASNVSVEKGQALAAGLGEPEDDVFRVLRGLPLAEEGSPGKGELVALQKEYDKLPTDAARREVKPLIEMVKRETRRRLRS